MEFRNLDHRFRFIVSECLETLKRVVVDGSNRHKLAEEVQARLNSHIDAVGEAMIEAFPEKPVVALGQPQTPSAGG